MNEMKRILYRIRKCKGVQVIETRCCESNVYQRLSLTVLRNLVFPNGELPLNYQLVRVSSASFSHGYIENTPFGER